MKFIAARMTLEQSSCTPIVAGLIAAARTGLRGMSRIDRNHRTPACFCLVRQELTKLCIRPTVHPAALFASPLLGTLANMRQVFNGNRAALRRGLHDLFTQDVITIPSKPCLLVFDPAQVPFRVLAAVLLQRTAQVEIAPFNRFPVALTKKLPIGRNGGLRQSKINADHRIVRLHIGGWHGHNDMQSPVAVPQNQISAIDLAPDVLPRIVGHNERDALPPGNRGKVDHLCLPIHLVRMHVIAGRTAPRTWLRYHPIKVFGKLQGTRNRFGGFHPRLNVQIRNKVRGIAL